MGTTEAGTRMASSHTGHLAGSDAVVDGLFRQYGVVRVRDLDELLETAALFAKLPAGTGGRCCLYSISGGSGTLMAEVAESSGRAGADVVGEDPARCATMIPDYLTVANPVDNGAQFLLSAPVEDRRRVFDLIVRRPRRRRRRRRAHRRAGAAHRPLRRGHRAVHRRRCPSPSWSPGTRSRPTSPGFRTLVEAGVPLFRSFRNCFAALRAFADYQEALDVVPGPQGAAAARLPAEAAAVLGDEADARACPSGADAHPPAARVVRGAAGR